jgi:acyl-CoA thioesterase I
MSMLRRGLSRVAAVSVSVIGGLILSAAAAGAQPDPVRVACIGNSITYGGLGDQSYPQTLGRLLGDHYQVRNFGVSGRTMLRKGDFPYWNEQAFYDAQDFNPQIIIICLGTNDSKSWNWVFKAEFFQDYTDFIAVFRQAGRNPQIYACFPPPVFKDGYGITNAVIRDQIIPLIDSVRQTSRTLTIDFYTVMKGDSALFPDGIHPNAAGYHHMAEIAYDSIMNSPAGFVRSFTATPDTVEQGQAALLVWETTPGSHVTLNGAGVGTIDSMSVSATTTSAFTLIASGADFVDTSRLVLTYLPPGVVKDFTADPVMLDEGLGESSLLRWRTSSGSAVTLDGVSVGGEGSASRTPLATTTYRLIASGDLLDTATVTVHVLPSEQINRALHHPSKASATERGYLSAWAVDGDTGTIWKSPAATFQWVYVDLGRTCTVDRVVVRWGAYYATTYHIQVLDSSGVSKNAYSTTAGDGGTDDLTGLQHDARYVRILCTARNAADSGYVVRELEVYGRPASVTGAPMLPEAYPGTFTLEQNYPNPFNGQTEIRFELPRHELVRLRVYDLLGREVRVVVQGECEAGRHFVVFDAGNLASGVYAYRLEAGSFVAARRLVLLK